MQLALSNEKSVLKIGADLGMNSKTIHNWIREHKLANNIKIDARRTTKKFTAKETIEDENIRLRAENKILKQGRDILKEAAAYFAKDICVS
ncbi:MAG: hypothetical protein NTW78_03050 [Campylobacterales bacterium]|nr:hypothetical protein [Campylobacterales bacterium]